MVLLSSPQPSWGKYPIRVLVSFCVRTSAAPVSSKHQASKQPKDNDPCHVCCLREPKTPANPTVIRCSSSSAGQTRLSISRFKFKLHHFRLSTADWCGVRNSRFWRPLERFCPHKHPRPVSPDREQLSPSSEWAPRECGQLCQSDQPRPSVLGASGCGPTPKRRVLTCESHHRTAWPTTHNRAWRA